MHIGVCLCTVPLCTACPCMCPCMCVCACVCVSVSVCLCVGVCMSVPVPVSVSVCLQAFACTRCECVWCVQGWRGASAKFARVSRRCQGSQAFAGKVWGFAAMTYWPPLDHAFERLPFPSDWADCSVWSIGNLGLEWGRPDIILAAHIPDDIPVVLAQRYAQACACIFVFVGVWDFVVFCRAVHLSILPTAFQSKN